MGWISAPEGLLAWNEESGWRWMFGVTAIPSVLFLLGMLIEPESPRWLVKNGHSDKAAHILAKIGGEDYARHVLESIESTLENSSNGAAST